MRVTPDPEYRSQLLDDQRARMGSGVRRDGIHVSDLVMCARKAWAERQTAYAQTIDDNTVLMFVRGLSHEDLFAAGGSEQVRSGFCFPCQRNHTWDPQIADSGGLCPGCGEELLVGTIDWVELAPDDYTPIEMKSTLKSSRQELERDIPWYLDQIKSYMFMHSRQKGRVCVLHIMGDYQRMDRDERGNGPRAELKVYACEWNSEEERQAWGDVLKRRRYKVTAPIMPALDEDTPAHSYICDYCVVGERLPDGSQCERFPWNSDGTRKGSKRAVFASMSIDEMLADLETMKEEQP